MYKIIINADDFGLNESCTKAICNAFRAGLITDTTMVANGEAFDLALGAIKEYRLENKIGIHFNLTEGKPLTTNICDIEKFTHDGIFHGKVDRVKLFTKKERTAIYEELSAQIERLQNVGIVLSHVDSHHHIHTGIFLAPIFIKVCKEHGIQKIRIHRNIGRISRVKMIVKRLFNLWLKLNGFKVMQYFGAMEDVKFVGIKDNLEIMVHPEYDKAGTLIDKIDELDGHAVGRPLVLPAGEFILRGYRDL